MNFFSKGVFYLPNDISNKYLAYFIVKLQYYDTVCIYVYIAHMTYKIGVNLLYIINKVLVNNRLLAVKSL